MILRSYLNCIQNLASRLPSHVHAAVFLLPLIFGHRVPFSYFHSLFLCTYKYYLINIYWVCDNSHNTLNIHVSKIVFGSVVVVTFQIAFRAEIHANDIFSFFKNHFWHQHIKTIQKVQTALNFSKKKKQFKIWSNAGSTAEPNRL